MDTPPNTVKIEAELPVQLLHQVEALVAAGWYRDANALFVEALRRYLDAHRPELTERFLTEDFEWGLKGAG